MALQEAAATSRLHVREPRHRLGVHYAGRPASTTGEIPSCSPMAVRRAGVSRPPCKRRRATGPRTASGRFPPDKDVRRSRRLPPAGLLKLRDTGIVGGELARTAGPERVTADPAGDAAHGRCSAAHDRTDAVGGERSGAGVAPAAQLAKQRPWRIPRRLEVTPPGGECGRPDVAGAALALLIGFRTRGSERCPRPWCPLTRRCTGATQLR